MEKMEVKWDDESCGFNMPDEDLYEYETDYSPAIVTRVEDLKVIGNIYENSKLLNKN